MCPGTLGGAAGWLAGQGGGQLLPVWRGGLGSVVICARSGHRCEERPSPECQASEVPSVRELARPHPREVSPRVVSALAGKPREPVP